MHSVYARFNNISATLSTCLMVLLGAIACTSLLFTADPKGDITASVKVCVQLTMIFLLPRCIVQIISPLEAESISRSMIVLGTTGETLLMSLILIP